MYSWRESSIFAIPTMQSQKLRQCISCRAHSNLEEDNWRHHGCTEDLTRYQAGIRCTIMSKLTDSFHESGLHELSTLKKRIYCAKETTVRVSTSVIISWTEVIWSELATLGLSRRYLPHTRGHGLVDCTNIKWFKCPRRTSMLW